MMGGRLGWAAGIAFLFASIGTPAPQDRDTAYMEEEENKKHPFGAVVIGGEHPGLGVARSLGRRGIPVVVIDDQHSVSAFSRYVKKTIRVKDLLDERAAVDALLAVGKRAGLDGWVLYPTRDETVAAISRYRDELTGFFRVPTPEWDTVRWAWDKKNTYELAEQLGIPCPKTFTVKCVGELGSLHDRLPLAIKPAIKENFFYEFGAKAWRADTPEELEQMWKDAARQIPPAEILLQEIIPGDGTSQTSYCSFFRDGESKCVLLAKRMRQHPREFGRAATYVETVEVPLIEELSERFLRHINYYGLVEIEFKLDARDGQHKLLDVNARTWGFHALGAPAGVDFPYVQFADIAGWPVEPSRGKPNIGWLRLVTDIPTVFSDLLSGHLGLSAYFQSLRRTRIESVFAKDDIMPSLAELILLPYLVFKKTVRRST